jgi:HPr kinase/phosphorylase
MTAQAMTVANLLDSRLEAIGLPITILGGAGGLSRPIVSPHVQKMGLALAGFDTYLQPGRILVFGESEVRYLESLDRPARRRALEATLRGDLPCLLLTGGLSAPDELLSVAEARALPVLLTPVTTPMAIAKITTLLDDRLAVRETIHGVLVDTLGVGVLLVGESGIGKSECALDLVVRGHRLVADDTVDVRRRGETTLVGSCPPLTRHHMEVRGLGLINVRDLFGVASTRSVKQIELVVQLERWDPAREYERLGIDEDTFELLGLRVPLLRVPVAPGRSLASLVEVAARNQVLRSRGRNAARLLAERVDRAIARGGEPDEADLDDWLDLGGPK